MESLLISPDEIDPYVLKALEKHGRIASNRLVNDDFEATTQQDLRTAGAASEYPKPSEPNRATFSINPPTEYDDDREVTEAGDDVKSAAYTKSAYSDGSASEILEVDEQAYKRSPKLDSRANPVSSPVNKAQDKKRKRMLVIDLSDISKRLSRDFALPSPMELMRWPYEELSETYEIYRVKHEKDNKLFLLRNIFALFGILIGFPAVQIYKTVFKLKTADFPLYAKHWFAHVTGRIDGSQSNLPFDIALMEMMRNNETVANLANYKLQLVQETLKFAYAELERQRASEAARIQLDKEAADLQVIQDHKKINDAMTTAAQREHEATMEKFDAFNNARKEKEYEERVRYQEAEIERLREALGERREDDIFNNPLSPPLSPISLVTEVPSNLPLETNNIGEQFPEGSEKGEKETQNAASEIVDAHNEDDETEDGHSSEEGSSSEDDVDSSEDDALTSEDDGSTGDGSIKDHSDIDAKEEKSNEDLRKIVKLDGEHKNNEDAGLPENVAIGRKRAVQEEVEEPKKRRNRKVNLDNDWNL